MSVVRLQFEYQLSLPYTLPLGLPSSSESFLQNRAFSVEKGTVHKLKPSPFTSSIWVWYSARTPTFPSISQPLHLAYTHFIPQAYLRTLSGLNQGPVLDTCQESCWTPGNSRLLGKNCAIWTESCIGIEKKII
jgi:hypothetical protein